MHLSPMTIAAILLLPAASCWAQINIGETTTVSFASVAEGKAILMERDDFVQRMSPFDRAARLKTDQAVSEQQYLDFVAQNVLEWTDDEKQTITKAFREVLSALASLELPLPKTVLIVKTTGREEGGAAYTRANAIVLPRAELNASSDAHKKKLCHELFHILSRVNPDLRDDLYAAIGFEKCDELVFPQSLTARKITNPDAPWNRHCIRLKVDGQDEWAIPILTSRVDNYDVDQGGEIFDYLEFHFLLVDRDKEGTKVVPKQDGETPNMVGMPKVSGFFEQVGMNTRYIIHPEEILADNFAMLVVGESDVRSPEVMAKIRSILAR